MNKNNNHGGHKRTRGRYSYMDGSKLRIGLRHYTMTKLSRLKFYFLANPKHGASL
jgi:hypothetical protein